MLGSSNESDEQRLPLSNSGTPPPASSSSRGVLKSAATVAACAALAFVVVSAGSSYYDASGSNDNNDNRALQSAAPADIARGMPDDPSDVPRPEDMPGPGPDDVPRPEDMPGPPPDFQRDDGSTSLVAAQFSPDPYQERDHLTMIVENKLTLVDVRVMPDSFERGGGDGYKNVWCDFCDAELGLNRDDPTTFPSFRDIAGNSRHCSEHRYSLPCADVITAVRTHDALPTSTIHPIPTPTGILLHEGRVGATMLSNALTVAQPEETTVIAEHPAPLAAVQACDKLRNKYGVTDCDPAAQVALLQDVVMLLSRTSDPKMDKLYLKMHASGSSYINLIRQAFPNSKWGFVYRGDATVALTKATQRKRDSCKKMQKSPSSALLDYVKDQNVDLNTASKVDVCSMHLATLVAAAKNEFESSGSGLLIDYDQDLKHAGSTEGADNEVINTILPYFGIDTRTNASAKGAVLDVIKMNANSRGGSASVVWSEDQDEALKGEASEDVKGSSEKFVGVESLDIGRARGRGRD